MLRFVISPKTISIEKSVPYSKTIIII
jgi:hypothetical protein